MKGKIVCLWLVLMVMGGTLHDAAPGLARSEKAPPSAAAEQPLPLAAGDANGVEVGPEGGTVDLPGGGQLIVPAGAVQVRTRFSRYSVEMNQVGGLRRYHPLGEAVHVEARRSDTGAAVTTLQRSATARLNFSGPLRESQSPAVRAQKVTGWELVSSSLDRAAMALTITVSSLPVTLAMIDDSTPPGSGEWDPADPAAVQLGDGSWGVAYTDAASPAHTLYRRYLGTQEPPYWLDAVTVDTGVNYLDLPVPALVTISSTLALFYRKTTGGVKQVFLCTSTDDGINWSSATQLTTESVDIYQVQASNVSGTVYLFWSLSNTSGTLQYKTSTDLSNWSSAATVGQAIGPWQNGTNPGFDIKKFGSGTWGLVWLNPATCATPNPPCTTWEQNNVTNNYFYPVVWYATSTDLSSWSSAIELSRPWSEAWPAGLSLAQTSGGTVYVSYRRYHTAWGSSSQYNYFRTSTNDGASWSVETLYGYEPARDTGEYSAVFANNSYLAVDSNGNIRSFWDQRIQNVYSGQTGAYPTQLFFRDLPSGAITPISANTEVQSQSGLSGAGKRCRGDPVNVATGNFTLPETDVAIPARGPGLAFQRTYNSLRRVDGPLGYGGPTTTIPASSPSPTARS